MGYQVSVRDVGHRSAFAKNLENGLLLFPRECEHNADILEKLLRALGHVVPGLSSLSDGGFRLVAGAVAYTLRPDLLGETRKKKGVERTLFKSDPDLLHEGFLFPPHYDQCETERQETETAREFFRCLSVPYAYVLEFKEKVKYGATFSLADAMARVVDTSYFTPYRYTPEQVDWYRETLERDLSEM